MDENYKGHHVQTQPTLNPDTNRWTPKGTVSWDEHGTRQIRTLDGPVDHCASEEEAGSYAIQMGKKWIDNR